MIFNVKATDSPKEIIEKSKQGTQVFLEKGFNWIVFPFLIIKTLAYGYLTSLLFSQGKTFWGTVMFLMILQEWTSYLMTKWKNKQLTQTNQH